MKRVRFDSRVCLLPLVLIVAPLFADGPKERIEERAESPSPRLDAIAATTIGGGGVEQVAGAGITPDGKVILFLNTWGPDLPQLAHEDDITILGRKQSRFDPGQAVYEERGRGMHGARLNHENTNVSGVILRCNRDMTEVERIFAFGFGVARFGPVGSCKVAPDGGLIVSGRGQPGFAALAPYDDVMTLEESRDWRIAVYEEERAERERVRKAGRPLPELPPGDERVAQEIEDAQGRVTYIARLSPETLEVEWVFLVDEITRAPSPSFDFRFDKDGGIVFPFLGRLQRLSPDGNLDGYQVALPQRFDAWALGETTDTLYMANRFASDTGWEGETFDSPFLAAQSLTGEPLWRAWGWSGLLVGLERYRLLAPSRIEALYPRDESIVVHATHEAINSVFARSPIDLDDTLPTDPPPLMHSVFTWRGTPKANLLIDLDAHTRAMRRWTYWSASFPDERRPWGHRARRPSNINIASLIELGDESVILSGRSETGLPATKHAWVSVSPLREYESAYVSVLDPAWSRLRFSTYIPAVHEAHAVVRDERAIVFGNALERDELETAPLHRPIQKSFGGAIDAWFALLDLQPLTHTKGESP